MDTPLPISSAHAPENEKPQPCSGLERMIFHFKEEPDLNSHLFEIELFLLALAIGIQDAISFPDFHCFASNQTGNTVLFAVGVLLDKPIHGAAPLFSVSTIAVSLGFFSLGVFMTGQTANYLRIGQTRGWLLLTSILQTVLVFASAGLQWHYQSTVGPDTTLGRVVVALLAFSSGSQVAVVRALKVTDITTAMATSAYIDIFIDKNLFAALTSNRGRNRRIVFLLMLVLGSFIGAGVGARTNFGVAVLISAIIKAIVVALFFVN